MSRLVKIVNNKYVQIEEYKNPNICFNTNDYDNFEDYCTLRETFDPFEIFYENQELKQKYLNAVADYETTMFEKEQLNSLVNSCQEEIRQLKKQLEEANEKIILLQASEPMLNYKKALEENQQKEFIKYLENEKDRLARICNNLGEDKFDEADDILQKYKSIIGGKCES